MACHRSRCFKHGRGSRSTRVHGVINETYGSGAAAAYGTRRLNGNYSGACMTIRRASDGTTQAIGFVGEEIDESAITTFCTGTTCTVQVWHDQSQTGGTGSGNDATKRQHEATDHLHGRQLVKEGGRLSLDFDANDYHSLSGLSITSGTGIKLFLGNECNGRHIEKMDYALSRNGLFVPLQTIGHAVNMMDLRTEAFM